ncbi:hypothetical protein LTR17_016197 [Elasticomyces elasticus]|nr:hypothetical protein LTR17_016197 [Elasticomyces elasticus]
MSNCTILVAWSLALRVLDRQLVEPMELHTSDPEKADAVIFLGRRNSALILEGSRAEIAKWTGAGLMAKEGVAVYYITTLARVCSVLVLLWIFITIPNGTTYDQLAFIFLCLLGQMNVALGQRFNGAICLESFEHAASIDSPTRTHVYASLLQKFGDGPWVDATQLLPETTVWSLWRTQLRASTDDPKVLYTRAAAEHDRRQMKFGSVQVTATLATPENV